MATAFEVPVGASVFAPRNLRASYGREYQTSDVFARERTSAAVSDANSARIKVQLSIAGELIELTYCGSELPEWATPVLRSLPERWGATPGWDTYQAVPTRLSHVVTLLNALSSVMRTGFPVPQVTPLSDGGAQAEWHTRAGDLEIVIESGEDPSYYFFDRATNEEEDNLLPGNEDRVTRLIESLR
jgi:hypothetical protein